MKEYVKARRNRKNLRSPTTGVVCAPRDNKKRLLLTQNLVFLETVVEKNITARSPSNLDSTTFGFLRKIKPKSSHFPDIRPHSLQ
jgi:hypothetical protein